MPVYLNFFNGRHTIDAEIDDWGFEGPVLGPFGSIQVTYGCHIKGTDNKKYFFDFRIIDGLVEAYGCFYGDFSIIDTKEFTIDHWERWKKTKEIVRSNTDPALFLNEKDEWVKVYIEKALKGTEERIIHGFYNGYTKKSPAPRRVNKRGQSPRRRKSP